MKEEQKISINSAKEADIFLEAVDETLKKLQEVIQNCEESGIDANLTLWNQIDEIVEHGILQEIPIFVQGNISIEEIDSDILLEKEPISKSKFQVVWSWFEEDEENCASTKQEEEFVDFIKSAIEYLGSRLQFFYSAFFLKTYEETIPIGLRWNIEENELEHLVYVEYKNVAKSKEYTPRYIVNLNHFRNEVQKFDQLSGSQKAHIISKLAHEMTHIMMYELFDDNSIAEFPQWFVEGIAQASSGVVATDILNEDISPKNLRIYMGKLQENPYGAGYLAVMFLGYLIGKNSQISSTVIQQGLDQLIKYMVSNKGITLDYAIRRCTGYKNIIHFQGSLENLKPNSIEQRFVQDFLQIKKSGAGCIFGVLDAASELVFYPEMIVNANNDLVSKEQRLPYASNALYIKINRNYEIPIYRFSIARENILSQMMEEKSKNELVERLRLLRVYYTNIKKKIEPFVIEENKENGNEFFPKTIVTDAKRSHILSEYAKFSIIEKENPIRT